MQHPEIIRKPFFPEVCIADDTEWQKENKEERRKKRICTDKWGKYHRIEEKYPKYRPREGNIITKSNMCQKKKYNPYKNKRIKGCSSIKKGSYNAGTICKKKCHQRIYLRYREKWGKK
jgi:hypothetical protein